MWTPMLSLYNADVKTRGEVILAPARLQGDGKDRIL